MRYQNWDALIFPGGSKIPIQEFNTSCHVVPDHESSSLVPNALMLLPTVTCFVPGIPPGFPFRLSLHCWDTPEISRYTQSYSKHPENVMFEARIYIDGKLSGRRLFQRSGPWPMIMDASIDRDRNGDPEDLKFPKFHAELLTHQYWNAGDDLGRIKIVLSEGFPRDSVTMPLERVKNIVAFSFQHAPLEILETSMIAWPNPGMWRQGPYTGSYIAQPASPQKAYEEIESHSHSPRRKAPARSSFPVPPPFANMLPPQIPGVQPFPRASNHDPFYDLNGILRKSSSTTSGDISMPDYSSYHISNSNSHAKNSRNITDSSQDDGIEPKQRRNLQSAGAYEHICEALSLPAAPANTPLNNVTPMAEMKTIGHLRQPTDEVMEDSPEIDPSLRESVFEGEIKSKTLPDSPRPIDNPFVNNEGTSRKSSLQFTATNASGSNKRQRIVTPASFRGVDENETEQPRASPVSRKVSLTLGGIQNIR